MVGTNFSDQHAIVRVSIVDVQKVVVVVVMLAGRHLIWTSIAYSVICPADRTAGPPENKHKLNFE